MFHDVPFFGVLQPHVIPNRVWMGEDLRARGYWTDVTVSRVVFIQMVAEHVDGRADQIAERTFVFYTVSNGVRLDSGCRKWLAFRGKSGVAGGTGHLSTAASHGICNAKHYTALLAVNGTYKNN